MTDKKALGIIGYASGLAANDEGCKDGPVEFYQSQWLAELAARGLNAAWLSVLFPVSQANKYATVTEICSRLSDLIQNSVHRKQRFAVLGGDHSCAIGTWSGVASEIRDQGDLGLIWVDAHLDSHTPETTETGNIHGMPVAALLGHGDSRLISIGDKHLKIKPENLCFIGARSYERSEHEFIKNLGVKIFYIDDVKKFGMDKVLKDACQIVKQNTRYYGLSIDLDSIDPTDAPGVGVPEQNGIRSEQLINALKKYCAGDPKLIGYEITEFNPHHDKDHKTYDLIGDIVLALKGE